MSIFNPSKPNIKKLKTKKKVKPLIKALKYNKDWNIRKSAAEALIAIGWEPINGDGIYYLIALEEWNKLIHIGEFAVEPLIKILKDKKSFVFHRDTIKALGTIKDKRAVEPLIEILQDKEKHLHEAVIKALGQLGGKKVVKQLISVLQNQDSITLRCKTIRALGSMKDKQAVEPLIEVLQQEIQKPHLDAETTIIIEVAAALGEIKDERAITHLVSLYNVYTDYVNKKIQNALLKINTELTRFYYAILNSDENKLLEIDNAFDLAIEALYQGNNWVRRQAIWALMILRDYRTVTQIENALNDKDLIVVSYAIYALGEKGDNRAVMPLIDILLKKDFPACRNGSSPKLPEHLCGPRSEAAVALGKIKDKRALKPLIKVIEEEGCHCLIEKSAWALIELGDERAIEPLRSVKNHTISPSVVQKAIDILENF